jgi:hypothetical protein
LVLVDESWWRFVMRPWTGLILGFSFALLIYGAIGTIRMARRASAARKEALALYRTGPSASAN